MCEQEALSPIEKAQLVRILFEASVKLEMPVILPAKASIYLHKYLDACENSALPEMIRVKQNQTLEYNERRTVVLLSALLFVSGKASEYIRNIRDIVNVVRKCLGKGVETLESGTKYNALKTAIVEQEQAILRALGFDLDSNIDHHKYLLNYAKYLSVDACTVKMSVNLLNDFFLTDACIHLPNTASMSAAACLCIAISLTVPVTDADTDTQGSSSKHTTTSAAAAHERLCGALQVSIADMRRAVNDVGRAQLMFSTDTEGKIVGEYTTTAQKQDEENRKEKEEED